MPIRSPGRARKARASRVTAPAAAENLEQLAAARPPVVDGNQTDLSVLAGDDGGEAGLRYAWSVLDAPAGAPPPALSDNGTNAARHATATFFRAGTYVFRVTVVDAMGLSVFQTVPVEVRAALASVNVSPRGLLVPAGGSAQFSARPPAGADLLRDLDLDGAVTAADLLLVRRRAGATIG